MSRFRNPQNGHTMKVSSAMTPIWAALFGWAYWVYQGIWSHAVLSAVAYGVLISTGLWPLIVLVMIGYAAASHGIVDRHYLMKGWQRVDAFSAGLVASSVMPGERATIGDASPLSAKDDRRQPLSIVRSADR